MSRMRQYAPLALMLAYLAAVRLLIGSKPAMFRSAAQAGVFQWPFLGIVAVIAIIGTVLSTRAGFPLMWDARVPLRRRLALPIAGGILLGVVAIVTDQVTHWAATVAKHMHLPSIHISWPASLFIYPGGAILVSMLYFLFILPLFLAPSRGRGFWIAGVLAAAIEPLTQDLHFPGSIMVGSVVFIEDYALNLGQVWLFRRAGFVAAVLLRVVFYILWHMLWPALGH
jgi:hypothetical protein